MPPTPPPLAVITPPTPEDPTRDWSADVLEAASTAYAVIDPKADRLVWYNRAFREAAARAGRPPEQHAQQVLAATDTSCRTTRLAGGENEEVVPLLIECPPPEASAGAPLPADRDPLTGTLGRGALLTTLGRWHANSERQPFAVAFLDLDRFKQINDQFGHATGDRCLEEVGDRLHDVVRSGDVVGRYGGDEFLLLLRGVGDDSTFAGIRTRLDAAITAPYEACPEATGIGVSVGVAYSRDKHATPGAMIEAADRAMYADKRSQPGADGS